MVIAPVNDPEWGNKDFPQKGHFKLGHDPARIGEGGQPLGFFEDFGGELAALFRDAQTSFVLRFVPLVVTVKEKFSIGKFLRV